MGRKDLLDGGVPSRLASFAAPLFLSNLLQSVYTMADMMVIGNVDDAAAMAAIAAGGQLCLLVTNAASGFSSGAVALISQYLGAGRLKEAGEAASTLFALYLRVALCVGAAFTFLSRPLLSLMSLEDRSLDAAVGYVTASMWGSLSVLYYNAASAVLRACGDSKRPLVFVAVSCTVSVCLDIIFIGLFRWGVGGAAAATLCGQALSAVLATVSLHRSSFAPGLSLDVRGMRMDKGRLGELVRLSLPVCLQQALVQVSFLSVQSLANSYDVTGSSHAALFGVANRVSGFATTPGNAVSLAVAAMAGQCIGAGRHERAKETALWGLAANVAIGALITAGVCLAPAFIVSLFTSDPSAVAMSPPFIRGIAVSFVVTPAVFAITGLATGAGRTVFVLGVTVACSLAVRVPMAYLLSSLMGFPGIGLAMGLASFGGVAQCVWFMAKKRWTGASLAANIQQ